MHDENWTSKHIEHNHEKLVRIYYDNTRQRVYKFKSMVRKVWESAEGKYRRNYYAQDDRTYINTQKNTGEKDG